MRRRDFMRLMAGGLVAGLVSACAPQAPATPAVPESREPKRGGTLTVALNGEIDTIDPHKSVTIVGFQVYTQIYEGLVRAKPTLDGVEPLLAESWSQPDPMTYEFRLRRGVRFHNGKDFRAEDVKFSFERVMDPNFGSPRRPNFTPVDRLEIVDDYTVRFVLKQPFAPFLTKLETLYILPRSEGIDFSRQPVGTGPFKFVEWVSGQRITVEKFTGYWQEGLPYIDRVVFRPIPEPSTRVVELRTGGVDLLNEVPFKDVAALEKEPRLRVYRVMGVVRDHVGFNVSKPPFQNNLNLRKAIAWAIDRDTIIESIMYGLARPAQVAIPESHWAFNPAVKNAYGYDLNRAREFYERADPKPRELTVKVSPTYPEQVKMAELLQQSLAKIGIDLKIVQLEWSTWIKEVVTEGNFEMEIVLISGGIDPDDFFYQWHHTGEVFNIWRYSDPEMDRLLEQARTETDQEKRKQLYYRVQEKLIADVPLVHILYRESIMASTAALNDFVMTGRYDMNFRRVWLDR